MTSELDAFARAAAKAFAGDTEAQGQIEHDQAVRRIEADNARRAAMRGDPGADEFEDVEDEDDEATAGDDGESTEDQDESAWDAVTASLTIDEVERAATDDAFKAAKLAEWAAAQGEDDATVALVTEYDIVADIFRREDEWIAAGWDSAADAVHTLSTCSPAEWAEYASEAGWPLNARPGQGTMRAFSRPLQTRVIAEDFAAMVARDKAAGRHW